MYIIDPQKRYKDGVYHVDFGAAALAMISYLRWKQISRTTEITEVTEASFLFLGKQKRWEVNVDFDAARKIAEQQAWAWVPKFYGWMDNKNLTGEQVLAEVLSIAKLADNTRRQWEEKKNAAYKASTASRETMVANLGMVKTGLEVIKTSSEVSLSVISVFNPLAEVGKAAITATDLMTKGVSIRSTALTVGVDLAIARAAYSKKIGGGIEIVAKASNKTIQAYISGKDIPDAAIAGLAEILGGITGKGPKGAYTWLKDSSKNWMIPLVAHGQPKKGALAALLSNEKASDVAGKLTKEATTRGFKGYVTGAPAGNVAKTDGGIDASNVLIGGAGHFEQLIRGGIYKLA